MDKKIRGEWLNLPKSEVFGPANAFGSGQMPSLHRDVLERFYANYPLLPIEFLKENPDAIEKDFPAKPVHHFLSSGTTARDRSRSSFSAQGLQDYKNFSLLSFQAMLETFPGGKSMPGISMIPPTSEWPTSSLAQMVAWLGELYPLTYWKENLPTPKQPVWLFATGFHIVSFHDEGGYFPLPPGSVVIETGGTKGKTRSVTRDETYSMIEHCFRVDKNHIVSEYGMCELASQAYDFVREPRGKVLPLHERWFRFPRWAQTKILDARQTVRSEGMGSLIINDQARSDIQTPFRTEDRVELRSDGAFQLQGRVAFSPLKGCSLLAEEILKDSHSSLDGDLPHPVSFTAITDDELYERAKTLHALTQKMLSDETFSKLILKSLGLEKLAAWCLQDLKNSVPLTAEAWVRAAKETRNESPSWLIIPPRTHDFALMHPLFMAALWNLKVVVRETKETDLLRYWQDLFAGYWQFSVVSSHWRLEEGTVLPAHSVMVFGSDDTISAIRAATSHPVHGFGNWVTMSVIHKDSWAGEAWVKDAFSLRQEGCMSSRLLLVWDEETPADLPSRSVKIGELSPSEQLHLAHSELDLSLNGFTLLPRAEASELVIGHKVYDEGRDIQDYLTTRPLTLPVVRLSRKQLENLRDQITNNASFKLITFDRRSQDALGNLGSAQTRELGHANEASWTGWHGTEPLFFSRD